MRTLVIGDIHGCFTALAAVTDAAELSDDDTLITLGDYVDRGPDSCAVIDWLIDRQRRGPLVALRGNHEQMMLEARGDWEDARFWCQFGGWETLASYGSGRGLGKLADVPDEHWAFLESTSNYYETDTHIFVHAGFHPEIDMADQPAMTLQWERFDDPAPHVSGKIVVCGHTPQQNGRPRNVGHAVCIDTAGWLTCLDVERSRYWQSDQTGNICTGWLDGPA